MDHPRVEDLLTSYAAGALSPTRENEVRQHLQACSECQEWLGAYAFLQEALSITPKARSVGHLQSNELAEYAVHAGALDEVTRLRCQRHVESCPTCGEEVALLQAALADESDAVVDCTQAAAGSESFRKGRIRLAWAASFLVGLGIVLGAHLALRTPEEFVLSGQDLDGVQTVKAKRSIVVDSTEVHTGASLGLESGQAVSFGEGFTVESGASLYVAIEDGNGS
jgi:anti-sigma factor RsiW